MSVADFVAQPAKRRTSNAQGARADARNGKRRGERREGTRGKAKGRKVAEERGGTLEIEVRKAPPSFEGGRADTAPYAKIARRLARSRTVARDSS